MKLIANTAAKAWRRRLSSALLGGALCLAAQTAGAQLGSTLTGSLITVPLDLSGLTATLSSLNLALLDGETTTGTVTLTNTSPVQSLQISSIALVMEFIGTSDATAPCGELSFFPSVAPGTILGVGQSLPISFTAVCTNSMPPLDLHEIMNLLAVTFVGSSTVWTSSAVSHL